MSGDMFSNGTWDAPETTCQKMNYKELFTAWWEDARELCPAFPDSNSSEFNVCKISGKECLMDSCFFLFCQACSYPNFFKKNK